MIGLRKDILPSEAALSKLKDYQQEIDGIQIFEKRSEEAKKSFSNKNTKSNSTFIEVKKALSQLCNNTRRCVYCEDSLADEVEHIYPKDLYPEKCFQWENYLYACGPCNGPKSNQFAVFREDNGEYQIVNPPKGEKAKQPFKGKAVMINPRIENPMEFGLLDLNPGSFMFQPLSTLDYKERKRFDYTYNAILRLNHQDREPIRQARENAYENYKSRFARFIEQKRLNAPAEKLGKMIDGIKKEAHPTVWKEMQRYHRRGWLRKIDSELDKMFNSEPEALNW